MTPSDTVKELEKKVLILEAQANHLTNELCLTKEERETSTRRYFDIYSNMEQKIAARTQKLLESKEKYRRIFENIQDVYYESSLEGDILEVSPSIENLSQYSRKELIGMSMYEIYADPKERDTLINELITTGKVNDYEITLTDKDGSLRSGSITSIIISDAQGTPVKIVGSMRDIMARKQAEEKLRKSEQDLRISERELKSVVNNAPDIIFRLDPEGTIIFINKTIDEYGFSKDELIGKNILELVHPEDRTKAIYRVNEKRTGDRRTKSLELRLLTKCLTAVSFESKSKEFGSFLIDAEGIYSSEKSRQDSFVGTIVVARDISERKRIEAQLQQAQRLESLGTMAGGIAHDFNNLLSIIVGNIELAQIDIKPEARISGYIKEVEKAALRAKDLTARLITFSRGGEPVKKAGSIGELLKTSVKASLGGSDIDCEFFIPDDLWSVEFDAAQMKQAIQNMVINANESMSGKGTIKVYGQNITILERDNLPLKNGQYIKISITDPGVGIPEKNLTKIFDPYFSTKEMGTQKGMGLGLSICNSIVEKHGGLITVESASGTGATFHIYLPSISAKSKAPGAKRDLNTNQSKIAPDKSGSPLCSDNHPRQIGISAPLQQSSIANRQSSIQKVLLMDDEKMIRDFSIIVLKRLGYEAEVSIDGAEAIEMYKKAKESGESFDAVILDLTNQFGMGGKEAIRKLLEIDPDVKGVVSTGYSDDRVVTNFKKYGFCGVLTKPYTIAELSKTLKEIMGREEKIILE